VDIAVEVGKALQLFAISHAVDGHLKKSCAHLDYEAESENPHCDDSVQKEGLVVDGDRPSLVHFDYFVQEVQHSCCRYSRYLPEKNKIDTNF
jgi:hypothetical protein